MAEPIVGTFETKQIHELDPLYKLNGREEVLIDNGTSTLRVTVDTLLGYIRDQINSNGEGSGGGTTTTPTPSDGTASSIHYMYEDEPVIPIISRLENHYYIRVTSSTEAKTGMLPRLIRVSPNMRLRLITD